MDAYLNHHTQIELIHKVNERQLPFFHAKLKYHYDEDDFNTEYLMCLWLDKNTTGRWGSEFLRIAFELQQDAVIYRLRFGK